MVRVTAFALLAALAGCSGGDSDGDDTAADPSGVAGDLDHLDSQAGPSKRSEILAAPHEATNSILIFGGNQGPIVNQVPIADFLGDTWVFEPGVGWTEITSGDSPRKRGRYSLSVDEANNRALLFGGRFRPADQGGNYTLYNDLWAFDFLTREWTLLDDGTSPDDPSPRYYPNSAWDAEKGLLYAWGGNTNTDPLIFVVTDDLFAWDSATGEWSQIDTTGEAPSLRSFLGSTHDTARNRIVVFGGQRGDLSSQAYQDTFALSLETFAWERLHNGQRTPVPSTRMHAHLLYDTPRDRYLLFGGHTDLGDLNDLWAMDPETKDWEKIYIADVFTGTPLGCRGNGSEVPADYVTMDLTAPERRHRGMYTMLHDSLWLFGGIHAECSDGLDDTWRYDLVTDSWHELIEATSGEACLRRQDDCECLCL